MQRTTHSELSTEKTSANSYEQPIPNLLFGIYLSNQNKATTLVEYIYQAIFYKALTLLY